MADAVGAVGGPDDQGQYLGSTQPQPLGKGWQKVFGFLDGVRGATDRVEAISGDVAGTVENVTDARRSVWELRRDKNEFDQDQFLEKLKVQRGDNVKQYWVFGAVALGVIVIFTGR